MHLPSIWKAIPHQLGFEVEGYPICSHRKHNDCQGWRSFKKCSKCLDGYGPYWSYKEHLPKGKNTFMMECTDCGMLAACCMEFICFPILSLQWNQLTTNSDISMQMWCHWSHLLGFQCPKGLRSAKKGKCLALLQLHCICKKVTWL